MSLDRFRCVIERHWFLCLVFAASVFMMGLEMTSGEFEEMNMNLVFPTPLMRMLNETAAATLREQTDNMSSSVTNTSLNDLLNDNDTQQLQIRYRERKRHERLLLIQREILQKLGFSRQQPNVTSRLSNEERSRRLEQFDRSRHAHLESSNDMDGEVQSFATCAIDGNPC